MHQRRGFGRPIMMCVAAFIAAAGCSSDGTDIPTTEELHGIWGNDDGTMNRVFVFRMQDATHAELAGKTNVYMLHFYPVGDPSVVVQTGTYSVEERLLNEGGGQVTADALVTRVPVGTGQGVRDAGAMTNQMQVGPADRGHRAYWS